MNLVFLDSTATMEWGNKMCVFPTHLRQQNYDCITYSENCYRVILPKKPINLSWVMRFIGLLI